jgi:predicted transposase/invertase (TIGR01784 family)
MDKWLYLLRHLGRLTRKPKALQGRIFEKIFTIAKISAMDTREYIAYQRSIKSYRDIKSGEISSYELGFEKGIEKGIEKGMEQGKEEGRQIERRNLVLSLSKTGFSADEIVRVTGFPDSEVESYLTD